VEKMLTLKQVRVGMNLSQIQLANFIGVSESTIIKYEKEPSMLKVGDLDKIIKRYNEINPNSKISMNDVIL
jgi:DNA-binding XRE family transcriptional regulator